MHIYIDVPQIKLTPEYQIITDCHLNIDHEVRRGKQETNCKCKCIKTVFENKFKSFCLGRST